MKVKGLPAIAGKKISYLQSAFNLSAEDALALKKGREIEVADVDADRLVCTGFVSAQAVETIKQLIKVEVKQPKLKFNSIVPDKD